MKKRIAIYSTLVVIGVSTATAVSAARGPRVVIPPPKQSSQSVEVFKNEPDQPVANTDTPPPTTNPDPEPPVQSEPITQEPNEPTPPTPAPEPAAPTPVETETAEVFSTQSTVKSQDAFVGEPSSVSTF